MEQPAQSAPVERLYMRLMVGRKGRPDLPAVDDEPPKKRGKKEKRPRAKHAGDFLLELTTAHIRPRRPVGI
jgi:hypothetical protein